MEAALPRTISPPLARRLAFEAGFTESGLVGLPYAGSVEQAERYAQFIASGQNGEMAYLARRNEHGELVRGRIEAPFPWARSVLVCMASYHADAPRSIDASAPSQGWIARYAWSSRRDPDGRQRPSDYHKVLLKRLRRVESGLKAEYGGFESRAYVDTGPVVERSVAQAAGLGWTGKNTCLIHPRFGSWSFLGVLVTELPVEEVSREVPLTVPDRCGSCTRCLDACPTGALTEPYKMDATRCIAYLTIEHRGEIAPELSTGMGRQVFGCDICQDVCPWNRKAPITQDEALGAREELINPELDWLADLKESDFERLFNGSPVRRTGFWGLRRNVAIAMGNSGLARYIPRLEQWLSQPSSAAPEGFIRAARWALQHLGEGGPAGTPPEGSV